MAQLDIRADASQFAAEAARISSIGNNMFAGATAGAGAFNTAFAGPAGLIASLARFGAGLGIATAGLNIYANDVSRVATSGYAMTRSTNLITSALEGFGLATISSERAIASIFPTASNAAIAFGTWSRAADAANAAQQEYLRASPAVRRRFDEYTRQAEAATLAADAYNAAVRRKRIVILATIAAVVSFTFVMFQAATRAAEFEAAIVRLQTQLNISNEAFAAASSQALRLAADYGIAANDLANASFAIQSAGLRGAEGLQATETAAKLAAIAFGDARSAGVLLAGAINAYGRENLTAARAGEVLLAIVDQGKVEASELVNTFGRLLAPANQLSIPLEDIGAAIATYTRLGVPTSEAVNAVRGALFALIKPSEQAKNIFEEFGITVTDVQAMIRQQGFVETLRFLRNEVAGSDEEFARIVPRIRGYGASLALTNKQAELYNEIQGNITASAGKLENAIERVQDTTANKWAQTLQTVNTLLIQMGEEVLPLVNDALDVVRGGIDVVGDVWAFVFGDTSARQLDEYTKGVAEFRTQWEKIATTDNEKALGQVRSIFAVLKEGRDDPEVFKQFVDDYIRLGEFDATANLRDTIGFLEQTREQFLGLGDPSTGVKTYLSELAGIRALRAEFDTADEERREQILIEIAAGEAALEQFYSFALKQSVDVEGVVRGINRVIEDAGGRAINFQGILRTVGGNLQDFLDFVLNPATGETLVQTIARIFNVSEEEAEKALRTIGFGLEFLYHEERRVTEETKRLRDELNLLPVDLAEVAEHLLLTQDKAKPTAVAVKEVAVGFAAMQEALDDLDLRKATLELVAYQLALDLAAGDFDSIIANTEAFFTTQQWVEYSQSIFDVRDALINGIDAAVKRVTSTTGGLTDAQRAQIDAWKEAERVAKIYFENVKDQIDDQTRALDRASEDVIDLINRQFTERFLQVAETANITADERRRIEARLRAQRDLSLAEARRENREESRRLEDLLEIQEDRRRIQEQNASNAIARIRAGLSPTNPLYVEVVNPPTETGGGGGGGTTTTTETGGDGGGGGTQPGDPEPGDSGFGGADIWKPQTDPNYSTYREWVNRARAVGLPVPPGLPTSASDMLSKIRALRAITIPREQAIAPRVQPGDPEPGHPDIGPVDRFNAQEHPNYHVYRALVLRARALGLPVPGDMPTSADQLMARINALKAVVLPREREQAQQSNPDPVDPLGPWSQGGAQPQSNGGMSDNNKILSEIRDAIIQQGDSKRVPGTTKTGHGQKYSIPSPENSGI